MKKLLSLLTVCVLLAASLSAAMAEALDLNFVSANPHLYTINAMADSEELTVISALSAADRAFTHDYNSQYYRSSTQFEVFCTADTAPALRLWVISWTDIGYMDVQRISLDIGGHTFIFTDVANPDLCIYARPSYMEKMLVTFEDSEFLTELASYIESLGKEDEFECVMILHGVEDVEVALGEGFMQDFLLMQQACNAMNGMEIGPDGIQEDIAEDEAAIESDDELSNEDAGSAVPPQQAGDDETVEETTDDAAAETGDTYIVVDAAKATVRDRAAIRLKPSISADILVYAYTGETFKLLEVIPNWYVIDVNGYTAYINQGVAKIVE